MTISEMALRDTDFQEPNYKRNAKTLRFVIDIFLRHARYLILQE